MLLLFIQDSVLSRLMLIDSQSSLHYNERWAVPNFDVMMILCRHLCLVSQSDNKQLDCDSTFAGLFVPFVSLGLLYGCMSTILFFLFRVCSNLI